MRVRNAGPRSCWVAGPGFWVRSVALAAVVVSVVLVPIASADSGCEGGIILGIHTSGEIDDGLKAGHAWVSVTDMEGETTTYGLWPSDHPLVTGGASDSDVRTNLEEGDTGSWNRYYCITEAQYETLMAFIQKGHKWRCTNTCASFASDAIREVTGEDVDADDLFGFETPREICKSIAALEKINPSSDVCPSAGEDPSSSSSSSCFDGPTGSSCVVVAVLLSTFTTDFEDGNVVVRWSTAAELENAGFNLLRIDIGDWPRRQLSLEDFFPLNESLIPAEGNAAFGADYEMVDETVQQGGTYLYLLEDVSITGRRTLHGADACTFDGDRDCKPIRLSVPH